jgi:hypothetical protein
MTSRRGAVRVNPVTGKMEKVDASAVPEGKHRDGCLLVDDRYVNAAKDLGLGNGKGACRAPAGRERNAPRAPPPPHSSHHFPPLTPSTARRRVRPLEVAHAHGRRRGRRAHGHQHGL